MRVYLVIKCVFQVLRFYIGILEIPLKLKIFKRTISLQIDVEAGSYQGETKGHTALGAESLGEPTVQHEVSIRNH